MNTAVVNGAAVPEDPPRPTRADDGSEIRLGKMMRELHAQALAGRGDSAMSPGALRALWDWLVAFIKRLAARFGLVGRSPGEPADGQLRGEAESAVALEAGDKGGSAPTDAVRAGEGVLDAAAPSGAQVQSIADAARQLVKHLNQTGAPTDLLSSQGGLAELERQIRVLAGYRKSFLHVGADLGARLDARLSTLAKAIYPDAKSVPEAVARIKDDLRGEDSRALLYDKTGELRAALKEVDAIAVASETVGIALESLWDVCQKSPDAGARERAVALFKQWAPEALSPRASPAAVGHQVGRQDGASGGAVEFADQYIAQADIPAQTTLESLNGKPETDATESSSGTAGLRLVAGSSSSDAALASPFSPFSSLVRRSSSMPRPDEELDVRRGEGMPSPAG